MERVSDIPFKILSLALFLVGVAAAVFLVRKQYQRSKTFKDLENTLPHSMTGPHAPAFVPRLALKQKEPQTMRRIQESAQPVPRSILERDLSTLRSCQPRSQPSLEHARRDLRAGSAPP